MYFKQRQKQTGYILITVILGLGLIAAISFFIQKKASHQINITAQYLNSDKAQYAAKAGLSHAIWMLDNNTSCTNYGSLSEQVLSDTSYNVTITPQSGSPVTITSVGSQPDGSTYTLTETIAVYGAPASSDWVLTNLNDGDTILDNMQPTTNLSTQTQLEVYKSSGTKKRIIVNFAIDELSEQPLVLTSANLELYLDTLNTGVTENIKAHSLTSPWLHSEATWENRTATSEWLITGGDYDEVILDDVTVDGDTIGWYQWDITDAASLWLETPQKSKGIALRATGNMTSSSGFMFTSANNVCNSNRPKISYNYRCECSQYCRTQPPFCSAEYTPSNSADSFDAGNIGASDVLAMDYISQCAYFNGSQITTNGALLLLDQNDQRVYLTDLNGNLLDSSALSITEPAGITYIDSGTYANHIAITSEDTANIQILNANTLSAVASFSTSSYTTAPRGITYLKQTLSGTHDGMLVVSSQRDQSGTVSPALFIVDTSGNLIKTININATTQNPYDLQHIEYTDKLLVIDAGQSQAQTIDTDAVLHDSYSTSGSFLVWSPRAISLTTDNCQHILSSNFFDFIFFLEE